MSLQEYLLAKLTEEARERRGVLGACRSANGGGLTLKEAAEYIGAEVMPRVKS